MTRYIDAHREVFGVEPICSALEVAPSTYYAAKSRPPCRRRVHDEELKPHIERVWRQHRCVYGPRKVYKQLRREGIIEPRCRIERLMRDLGLQGRVRGKRRRTTIPADVSPRPPDLVDRRFKASAPNQLWIADITYVATWSGFAYAAFVTDVFSRRILGWRVSNTLRADLALDALEMAIWTRQGEDLTGLVHHSDRGGQYLSIVYTERLAAEQAVTSVGSRGDSYDNAMAESIIGLYKSECITLEGPWRTIEDVELATCSWVHWWNNQRLLEPLGYVPPVEFEAARRAVDAKKAARAPKRTRVRRHVAISAAFRREVAPNTRQRPSSSRPPSPTRRSGSSHNDGVSIKPGAVQGTLG